MPGTRALVCVSLCAHPLVHAVERARQVRGAEGQVQRLLKEGLDGSSSSCLGKNDRVDGGGVSLQFVGRMRRMTSGQGYHDACEDLCMEELGRLVALCIRLDLSEHEVL